MTTSMIEEDGAKPYYAMAEPKVVLYGAEDSGKKSMLPPKKWFTKMAKSIQGKNPGYSDERIRATVGDIWYHKVKPETRQGILDRYSAGRPAYMRWKEDVRKAYIVQEKHTSARKDRDKIQYYRLVAPGSVTGGSEIWIWSEKDGKLTDEMTDDVEAVNDIEAVSERAKKDYLAELESWDLEDLKYYHPHYFDDKEYFEESDTDDLELEESLVLQKYDMKKKKWVDYDDEGVEYGANGKVEMVDIGKIKDVFYNSMKEMKKSGEENIYDITQLAARVKNGEDIGNAILVEDDGVYTIDDGHDIVSAYAVAGKSDVPAEILTEDESRDAYGIIGTLALTGYKSKKEQKMQKELQEKQLEEAEGEADQEMNEAFEEKIIESLGAEKYGGLLGGIANTNVAAMGKAELGEMGREGQKEIDNKRAKHEQEMKMLDLSAPRDNIVPLITLLGLGLLAYLLHRK